MATEKQLPKLAAMLVEHQNEFVTLSNEDTQWAILNPKEAIALACEAIRNRAKVAVTMVIELLLDLIGTVTVPATTDRFVAREKFVRDTGRKAKVKISFLGDNFETWFGNKVEGPTVEQTLRYAKLRKSSVDRPIIAELGDKAETTLTEMFSLMEMQKNGESGVLLNNGLANIFYVKDINAVLRSVGVGWDGGGWDVGASGVGGPGAWGGGGRVFSRN